VTKLPYIKCDLRSGNSGRRSGSLHSRLFNLQWKIQLVSYRTPIERASSSLFQYEMSLKPGRLSNEK
jgi:hypothetical protein